MPFDMSSLLSGMVGAIAGGLVTHFREKLKLKSDTTFRLHEEFSSEYMLRCRSQADDILSRHRGKNLRSLYEELPVGGTDAIWAVVGFYEKLSVAVTQGRIDNSTAPGLFGEVFIYWYHRFLKDGLKPNAWEGRQRLQTLEHWLQQNANCVDYQKWEKNVSDWPERNSAVASPANIISTLSSP